jgi:hypothetical protein
MRTLLLAALLCLPAALPVVGAVSFDNYKDGGYQGPGTHTTTIVASGTNLGCIVVAWYRGGSTGIPMCGGNAMTKIGTFTDGWPATVDMWIYSGAGLTAGTLTASVTATVESILEVLTVNGANQSGQPDAVAATVSGTTTVNGIGLPITTVANNSLVLGVFSEGAASHNPSSTAIWIGDDANAGLRFWRSTADVAPAGAFTLQALGGANGYAVYGSGLSISPAGGSVTAATANPSVFVIGPQ